MKKDGRKNNGGKPGMGRKEVEDKKKTFPLQVRKSRIAKLGSKRCKEIGENAIETEYIESINPFFNDDLEKGLI
jgi:hypothetical protein